jgi:hypothetical protein
MRRSQYATGAAARCAPTITLQRHYGSEPLATRIASRGSFQNQVQASAAFFQQRHSFEISGVVVGVFL